MRRVSILIHFLALRLVPAASLVELVPLPLLDLFHLIRIPAEGTPELAPGLEGDGDGVAVGWLHLAHAQEHAILVAAYVEEEALRIHRDGGTLRQLRVQAAATAARQLVVLAAVVVDELGESVAELDEALRGQRDGLPALQASGSGSAAACHRLANAQKAAALVLLEVQVVLAILAHEKLALERAPRPAALLSSRRSRYLLRAAGAQLRVVLDEVAQRVAELGSHGHGQREAALGAARAHLGDLEEAAFGVLLHIQVEALVLDVQPLRSQLLRLLLSAAAAAAAAGRGLEAAGRPAAALTAAVAVRHLLGHRLCLTLAAAAAARPPRSRACSSSALRLALRGLQLRPPALTHSGR